MSTKTLFILAASLLAAWTAVLGGPGSTGGAPAISGTQSNLKVVAYYTQWSVCDMPPQKLDWNAFTHLIYFWGEPGTSPPYFNLYAGSSDSVTFENGTPGWCTNPSGKTHQQVLLDSARAHNVKLILCVGGEYGNPASVFSAMIADTSKGGKQDQFIDAALGFVKRHGYNGIDVNWEYPDNSTVGRANFDRFCYKVRSILNTWTFADGSHGVFTMANPFWFWWSHSTKTGPVVNVKTINETMDFTDLEMYGMENTSRVSEYSPLYNNAAASQEYWDYRGPKEYLDAGVLPSKIVTLMPFECLSMNAASSTIGSAASAPTWIGLRDIPSSVLSSPLWDPIAMTSYGWSGGKAYLFETQQSINEKVKYVQARGIAGIGIWELWRGWLPNAPAGQQQPLLEYLKSAVGGFTPPPPDVTPPTVSLTSPSNGATVSGLVNVTASAADNIGVARVDFLVNGAVVASDNVAPYAYTWNAAGSTGSKNVAAKAYDAAGNASTLSTVTVTVAAPPPGPAAQVIFDEALRPPWKDSSWSATNVYNSTEEAYTGTVSVKSSENAWGALSVRAGVAGSGNSIDPSKFSSLQFALYNTTAGLILNVYCYNDRGDAFPAVVQANAPVNQWVVVNVPMSLLDPNGYPIDRVNIQNYTRLAPVFYVDDFKFVGSAAADVTPPAVSITSPSNGAAVSGIVNVAANASDNVGVVRVDFLINGTVVASDTAAPYAYSWNPGGLTGAQTVAAKAYDAAGNASTLASVTVTVPPPPPAPAQTILFDESLKSPWKDSSWNATNDYANTERPYSGRFSIKTTETAWGALSVRAGVAGSGNSVNPANSSALQFALYNTTSGLVLNVYCYNDRGDAFPAVIKTNIPVNQWVVINIPMSQLDPAGYPIDRVNIQNYTRLTPVLYVDDFQFLAPLTGSNGVAGETSPSNAEIAATPAAPTTYALRSNYPNPFNPSTRIDYQLADRSMVTLILYNVLGEEAARLADGFREAGYYSAVWNAGNAASGIYFARLTVSNTEGKQLYQHTMRMLLAK